MSDGRFRKVDAALIARCARLVASGLSHREIAYELGLSLGATQRAIRLAAQTNVPK